jgi:hypothetical protein
MRLQAGFFDFEADICPSSRVTNSRYRPLLLSDQTTYMIAGMPTISKTTIGHNSAAWRSRVILSHPSFEGLRPRPQSAHGLSSEYSVTQVGELRPLGFPVSSGAYIRGAFGVAEVRPAWSTT